MNYPSRTDTSKASGLKQSPTALTPDLMVREDLNGRINSQRMTSFTGQEFDDKKNGADPLRSCVNSPSDKDSEFSSDDETDYEKLEYKKREDEKCVVVRRNTHNRDYDEKGKIKYSTSVDEKQGEKSYKTSDNERKAENNDDKKRLSRLRDDEKRPSRLKDDEKGYDNEDEERRDYLKNKLEYLSEIKISKENIWNILATIKEYLKFVGPGFMISVAYIDPGNYSVNVSAGATFRFRLLYMGLIANLFSIFYHGLCVKLGSVTGLNLAEACRMFLPRWLNIIIYMIAEISIIATDVTEVVGTGIAVSLLLPKIPLQLACALSILDVIFIRIVSTPNGKLKGLRAFEFFVMALVIGVVICFCIQLCLIKSPNVGEVLSGYIPAGELLRPQGIYQACGILGSTLMPHSLYLGSGLIQPRLKKFDIDNGIISPEPDLSRRNKRLYRPSIQAINACMRVFITEVIICLFVFSLFVNSAILITAGSSLYDTPGSEADLFGIHEVLSDTVAPAAGTIFAFALLLSGGSAAIVCTLAGQLISSGAIHGSVSPWLRRLLTRAVSTLPSIIIATMFGRDGLDNILDASQAILSILLPFIIAPLIFFTSMDRYMTVRTPRSSNQNQIVNGDGSISWDMEALHPVEIKMGNHWFTTTIAILMWLFIIILNGANIIGKVLSSVGSPRNGALIR